MLDKHDITALRGMFSEQDGRFLAVIKANNQILTQEITRDIRDEVHSLIAASECRLTQRMDTMEKRITTDIAELLDTSVLPQIAALQMKLA